MGTTYSSSEKKKTLIQEKINSPIVVGERIYVLRKNTNHYIKDDKEISLVVTKIIDDKTLEAKEEDYNGASKQIINISDINSRWTYETGVNPFHNGRNIRFSAYTLQSILWKLGLNDGDGIKEEKYHTKNGTPIKNCNWNPHVINKDGEKEYYQRDYVWSIKDKQLLIESIYNGIDCGKILIREHSYEKNEKLSAKGETDLSFHDIVDGKQRLNAVHSFISNEYPDLHGNYYNDLSDKSQRMLTDNQLFAFAEMDSSTTDAEVIQQFLKLNFSGVPQSEEHIAFVRSIHNKL